MLIRRTVFSRVLLSAAVWLVPPAALHRGGKTAAWAGVTPLPAGRYLAVFADGQRVEGEEITGWYEHPASPKLDETALLDPRRPLRWLRDRTLRPWRSDESCPGYVELVGGDRLIGQIVGVERPDPGDVAAGRLCLMVRLIDFPEQGGRPQRDTVRIFETDVRRVVRGHQPPRALSPRTVFLRDGRVLRFLSMRWTDSGLRLLLDNGVRVVGFSDLAELHLPPGPDADRDWDAYYRELAVLCPDGSATLVRLETTAGMILTASTSRFQALARGSRRKPSHWYHIVQPAWAADPVWVPFGTIRTRWHFAPHEVPLSRLVPGASVPRATSGYPWRWQRNRSAAGGELIAGGEMAGWGFGVHAHSELVFGLPPLARSFRARVGLDAAAGRGGCARALVYLNAPKGRPLYRSKVLVGSAAVADTGDLKLPASGGGGRKLVLVADAAHRDRPAGADPYDIRDSLDWVEPVLHLDRSGLRAEVAKRIPAAMPALQGWQASVEGGDAPVRPKWDQTDRSSPRFIPAVATGGKRLTLSRRTRIEPRHRWLKLHVRQVGEPVAVGCVEIRLDGRTLARMPVNHGGSDLPYLVPMDAYRGREVNLQVIYTPGAPDESVRWQVLELVDRKTRVNWAALRPVDAVSRNGAGLKVQPDGSILAAGAPFTVSRVVDNYVISAVTDLPRITAIRLEALADSSLPCGGPGRWGGFTLSQFRLSTLPEQRRTVRGRYVRVELPGPQAALSLAEVQVFAPPPDEPALLEKLSGPSAPANLVSPRHRTEDIAAVLRTPAAKRGAAQRIVLRAYLDAISQNIARRGKASQSSTVGRLKADLAIDGAVRDEYTHTEVQDRPWWQVDLGAERQIDRIVVWNRIELDLVSRLRNFDVVVLDAARREVWRRRDIADPPVPAVELFDSDARDVPVAQAYEARGDSGSPGAARALDSTRGGWSVLSRLGESHAAVFVLAEAVDARRTGLRIELKHAEDRWWQTLGRFRLLATGDEPPAVAEPVAIVIRPAAAPGRGSAPGVPPTSPYALFEDDGRFEPVASADGSKVSLVSDDKHAGQRAARLEPGGRSRLPLGRIVPIRASPGEGEFRYVRLALRKYGGGWVSLGLEHLVSQERPCRYEAGPGTPGSAHARSVWPQELPAEWIVIDRDVYADFGRLDLTGLTVACRDGGHAVLDHVYVARTPNDFKRLPPAPSPAETNQKARRVLAGPVLERALPAVVSLDADGRAGTGVLVGDEGWVLTAGHLIAGVGEKVRIRTRDGRELAGRAAGIDRYMDTGLVRITDKGTWGGLKIGDARVFRRNRVYVGFSFAPSHEEGKRPLGYIAQVEAAGSRTARMDVCLPDAAVGGPLLDTRGRVVGVHNAWIGRGQLQFTRANGVAEHWDRMARGEVWGQWMSGSGPMMGIHTTQTDEGCRLIRVYDRTPAAATELRPGDIVLRVEGQPVLNHWEIGRVLVNKDPGDRVVVLARRGEKTFECKVGLMRHEPLPRRAPRKPGK